jgi:hypothetical protein
MKKFYVYIYLRPNYLPYYVGKGCGKRCYKNGGRPVTRPKCRTKIIKFRTNLSEAEAFRLEEHYIKLFGFKSEGGLLHNKTTGGEGKTPSKETRIKLSEARRKRVIKPETGTKISEKLRGRKLSTRQSIKQARGHMVPITLIHETGASITFESIKHCADCLGVATACIQRLKKSPSYRCKRYRLG